MGRIGITPDDEGLDFVKFVMEHPGLEGLYPCGEGAGYAGGIVSAALDGRRCAEALARQMQD